jgi:acyl-CoA thioesterase
MTFGPIDFIALEFKGNQFHGEIMSDLTELVSSEVIRILDLVPTDCVLCDNQVHGIAKGFGHGRVHLWSEDGRLMATGSQSLIVRLRD